MQWKDKSGEHTGFYHPMDFIHFLTKNLDKPSPNNLYQKSSICNYQFYFQIKASFIRIYHYFKLKQFG